MGGADIIFFQKLSRSEMEATESSSGSLDSPVSDIHFAKIAKDFIRNWEELAPYLRLLPAHEYEIKKDGRYGDQKREALRLWKEKNGKKATYRALIVVAKQVSNVELAEKIEALVAPKPTLKEDSSSHEKIQRYDGNTKAPETPYHYKHSEGVVIPGSPCSYYSLMS